MEGLLESMSKRSFPLKDLLRRRFQTTVTVLSLTISSTTTFFLLFFGENIGFTVELLTGGKLTTGFSYTFSVILLIITLLTFLTEVLVTSFLISLAMSERIRDVGVMTAVGCVTDLVFGYFVTELFIMVSVSCITGFVLGWFLSIASVNILNTLGLGISQQPINVWIIPYVFLAFLIVPNLIGTRVIGKALIVKPSEALSNSFSLGIPAKSTVSVPSKLGVTFKTAFKTLARRRIATRQAILCLSLVFALTTVSLAGGTVANQTTQSYVERAVQRNVVVIAHTNISRRYVDLLSIFSETKEIKPVNYSDTRFFIEESLISRLHAITGVKKTDARLMLETQVYEIPKIIVTPDQYIVIGDDRSSPALILGLEPENAVNDWLILGRGLNKTDLYSAMLGHPLAVSILADPEQQRIKILNKDFGITGVCQDPLNNGNVVYVPLKALQLVSGQAGYNLILLQIDSSNVSQTLDQIREEIYGRDLELVELNAVLQKHLDLLNTGWSLVILAPLFSLVTAVLCLSGYMALLISTQRRDLAIMRAIGAKLRSVMMIVVTQTLIIVLVSGAIGFSTGLLISSFLLPEPVISAASVLPIFLWFVVALTFLGVCNMYPTVRTVKKSVIKAISEL